MSIYHRIEVLFLYYCFRGKARAIAYSEGVFVALVIQHAKRMRLVILSSVACLKYFSFYEQFREILS